MTFRPDSPLNRLLILWPGVPIAVCACGFGLAVYQEGLTHRGAFATLAVALGAGLALSLGLLFHAFFISWLEVGVTPEGISLRSVGLAWLKANPRLLSWEQVTTADEVVTRSGGHLRIHAGSQSFQLDRALFREETFRELSNLLQQSMSWRRQGAGGSELAAAA